MTTRLTRYALAFLCFWVYGTTYAQSFTVSNSNNSGTGSLRQAILNANAQSGTDSIVFNIPGTGDHIIQLSSPLPTVTDPVLILGLTQPGAERSFGTTVFTGNIPIVLRGSASATTGITLGSGSSESRIEALRMYDFSNAAIDILATSSQNIVRTMLFGVNADVTAAVGNGARVIVRSSDNIIGDYLRSRGNHFSGCPATEAILFTGTSCFDNSCLTNVIGLEVDGLTVFGGIQHGIRVSSGAYDNDFGYTQVNQTVRIGGATGAGFVIEGASTSGISLSGCHIFDCGGIPIDINNDGVTPNDPGDVDSGPNEQRNFPTLLRGFTDADASVYAQIQFQGTAGDTYRVDWYDSGPSPNASGHGDTRLWLGRSTVTPDATGFVDAHCTFGRFLNTPVGNYFTATITSHSDQSTSECALGIPLTLGELEVTNLGEAVNGDTSNVMDLILNPGPDGISLREAILAGNNQSPVAWGYNHILFDVPGGLPATIGVTSELPSITEQTYVDGWSQTDPSAQPSIIVDGSSAGAANGLIFDSDYCFLDGMSFVNFNGNGIVVNGQFVDLVECYVGVMPDGVTPAGNSGVGILANDATFMDLGISSSSPPSVISANGSHGIHITNGSDFVDIETAFIGTDITGNIALGNGGHGVLVDGGSSYAQVGYRFGDDVIISANAGSGVYFTGAGTDRSDVENCIIGLNATATALLPNQGDGVTIVNGSAQHEIGKNYVTGENYFSGNVGYGLRIEGLGSNDCEMSNNIIGAGFNGSLALGNGLGGILIKDADANTIEGGNELFVNLISANNGPGITLDNAHLNRIANNLIGDSSSAAGANSGAGILIQNGSELNIIGGTSNSNANMIAYNTADGVSIEGATTSFNAIVGNSIHSNGGLGIDLANDGVTMNDAGDADSGPNDFQNFPELTSAVVYGDTLTIIRGRLSTVGSQECRIELFIMQTPDPSGFGEGDSIIDRRAFSVNASGNLNFEVTMAPLTVGHYITATATHVIGSLLRSSSEFSEAIPITPSENCNDGIDNDGDGLVDCGDCEDCAASALCNDYDGDLIGDACDFDDDNDGLLDMDEQNCSSTYLPLTQTINSTSFSGTLNGCWPLGATSCRFDYELQGTVPGIVPAWSAGIVSGNNGALLPDGDYLEVQPFLTNFSAGFVAQYRFVFSNSVENLEFKIGGLDLDEQIEVFAFHEGQPVPVSIVDINLGSDLVRMSNGLLSNASNAQAPSNSVKIQLHESVDSVLINSGKLTGSSQQAGLCTMQFYEMNYCEGLDSDLDGIANFVDLDSDNDGIYDAFEAGHERPFSGGVVSGGVDSFGIPLVVSNGSGAVNYVPLNSDGLGLIDAFSTDADGDGCYDVVEAGFLDPNGDGYLGGLPLTVGGTGLVISP